MTKTKRVRFRADVLAKKAKAAGDDTNYAISVRTGLRECTVSRLLAGAVTPSLDTVCAVAVAYGTTLDELVDGLKAVVPVQRTEAAA
ncbi:helix-turn-helix domain-containing protein [Streptomyces vinaceus]|uniref:helix-turn-helix domain-containing protein n=1 Tax=Streptomyces vinaceus TaxID=1960 RepID=UPI0036B23E83